MPPRVFSGWVAYATIAGLLTVALASVILLLPGISALWLVVGAGLVLLVVFDPFSAILLMPFAIAFGSLVSLGVSRVNVGPTDLLVGALVVVWLVRHVPQLRHLPLLLQADRLRALWITERARCLLFLTLIAYLLFVCLSLAVATDRVATLKEIIKWCEVLALVALSATYLRTAWQVQMVVWAIIGATVAEALLGYIQWVASAGLAGSGSDGMRVFGTFGQPNPYAGFLNFGLVLALALVFFGREVRERWVAGGASALLIGAQALAASRGALLGLIVAMVAMVVVGWRRERQAAFIAAVGVPLLVIGWITRIIPARIQRAILDQVRINDALSGTVTAANFSTVERIAHWIAGVRMFLAHPLLGVGAGNYNAAYPRYALPDWPDALGHAHNYYINAAAETGALGCAAFLALTSATFYLGWRTVQQVRVYAAAESSLPAIALGLFAALVALATHNLTDDLFVHAMELQFALIIGALLALLRMSASREPYA